MTFWGLLWRASAIGLGLAFAFLGLALASAWATRRGWLEATPPRDCRDGWPNDFFDRIAAERRMLHQRPTARCNNRKQHETDRRLS